MTHARQRGTTFEATLGNLLEANVISSRSIEARNLNYNNSTVRGEDIYRSLVGLGDLSVNEYSYMAQLKTQLGASTDYEIGKKVNEYEFSDPLTLICALGSQMRRLELRYFLNGIDFKEAYARKWDHFQTLLAIAFDLKMFGFTPVIVENILGFAKELVHPTEVAKLALLESNFTRISRAEVRVGRGSKHPKLIAPGDPEEPVSSNVMFDGKCFYYNLSAEVAASVTLESPVFDLYKQKRLNYGRLRCMLALQFWVVGMPPRTLVQQ